MVAINLLLIAAFSSTGLANFAGDPFSYYIGSSVTATFASTASQSSLLDVCTNYISAIQDTSAPSTTTATELNMADARNVCQYCTSLSQSRVDSCCAKTDSAEWASCFASAANGKAQATAGATSGKSTPASNPATATGGTGLSATASATKSSSGSRLRMVC